MTELNISIIGKVIQWNYQGNSLMYWYVWLLLLQFYRRETWKKLPVIALEP